jgi:hypothetical protein
MAKTSNYQKCNIKQGELNHTFLNSIDWTDAIIGLMEHKSSDYNRFIAQVKWEFENGCPLALSMKANAIDNQNWYQAMNGTESDCYWAAMEIEMETLIVKNAWVVLDREDCMHVITVRMGFK